MRDRGYTDLMAKAASADDDTTEIRDEGRRMARIARDESYPGAICVRLHATEDQTPYSTQWILPATAFRPSFYPDDLPFVSGISCRAKQAIRRLNMTWDDEDAPATDPESRGRLKASAPPVVSETIAALKASMDAGEHLGQAGWKRATDMLGDESVRDWATSGMAASKLDERFVPGFESILMQCLEYGWKEEEVSEDLPFSQLLHRVVALRRSDLQRVLTLSGGLGTSRLWLTQEPAEAHDSA